MIFYQMPPKFHLTKRKLVFVSGITNYRRYLILSYQLAEKIGITRASLSHYEKSRREPDFDTLKKLASFFGVTTDFILEQGDYKNNSIIIAASRSDNRTDDIPEQAIKEIENFKEFVRAKYSKKTNEDSGTCL